LGGLLYPLELLPEDALAAHTLVLVGASPCQDAEDRRDNIDVAYHKILQHER
jgi:hypothetical protein